MEILELGLFLLISKLRICIMNWGMQICLQGLKSLDFVCMRWCVLCNGKEEGFHPLVQRGPRQRHENS